VCVCACMGNVDHLKIIQTILEQHNGQAWNQGTTKKQPHTSESTNLKEVNIFHTWNNITCSTNCRYRTAATLYTLETWFVSSI